MFFTNSTYIGIDPSAGVRPFVYAALDGNLHPLALGTGRVEDVLAFAAGQHQAIVAVSAPRQPNQGIMAKEAIRRSLSPMPSPGRWVNFRLADYLIRQHNISSPQIPALESECPNWMQMGFRLYRKLEQIGYLQFPSTEGSRQLMEVYPHAGYTVLLDLIPFPKYSLEGRLQRQLVLYNLKVKVADPMLFFEEITSHRLLKGVLPMDHLLSSGELDALMCAYTAWLSAHHPDQITLLGDPAEGQVVLPVAELKSHYPAHG